MGRIKLGLVWGRDRDKRNSPEHGARHREQGSVLSIHCLGAPADDRVQETVESSAVGKSRCPSTS